MERQSEVSFTLNQSQGKKPTAILICALSLGLSVGFLDIILGLVTGRSRFPQFSVLFLPLSATTAAYIGFYFVLWFVIVKTLGRWRKIEDLPLAASLACVLGLHFILAASGSLVTYKTLLAPEELTELSIVAAIALLNSVVVYRALSKVTGAGSSLIDKFFFVSTITPCLLAASTVFLWLRRERINGFVSIPGVVVLLTYLASIVLILRFGQRIKRASSVARLLLVGAILVLLSPFLIVLSVTAVNNEGNQAYASNHRIKRVLLISVDTLRPDALSCYGLRPPSDTPNIDTLARDGVIFENAMAPAPWTLPSLSSIMTGLPPNVHLTGGLGARETLSQGAQLPDGLKTLAEYLAEAGYYTAAVGRNEFIAPRYNLSQGFHEYNVFPRSSGGDTFGSLVLRVLSRLLTSSVPSDALRKLLLNAVTDRASTDDLTHLAIGWLEANRQKEFFLWLHYLDPHDPYAPPGRFRPEGQAAPVGERFTNEQMQDVRRGFFVPSAAEREWIRKLYDAEVRHVDENIGKVLRSLKAMNLYEESLIILTSDHGEEFWEHNSCGHGATFYREVINVPLILKLPDGASLKGRVDTTVSTQSILPTVLELCGIKNDQPLWADSLLAVQGDGSNEPNSKPIFSICPSLYDVKEAVIFGGKKYIRSLITGREELFDLSQDPGEEWSIIRSSPVDAKMARALLSEFNARARELRSQLGVSKVQGAELDEAAKRRLRSLGYIK